MCDQNQPNKLTTPAVALSFRQQFPFFQHNPNLIYLDNAATTQKPQVMLDALCDHYINQNANVHRGAHSLAAKATANYEQARITLKHFINATDKNEIIWTKGTTDSINLVAHTLAQSHFKAGDEIIVTALEHHANFVPWQQIAKQHQLKLTIIPATATGYQSKDIERAINRKTKLIAFAHVSNALGFIAPIKAITELAQQHNIATLIDGAQAVAHERINVQALNCDFYVFSAHKVFGPTGLGVMYGKTKWLQLLPPYQYGGEMVKTVTATETTFAALPHKFEAGTPNIADVIAFGKVIKWYSEIDRQALQVYEKQAYRYLYQALNKIKGITLYGSEQGCGAISFTLADWHPNDVSELLNQMNIAIRTGSHCAQPLMQSLHCLQGTIRVSLCAYNTLDELDRFISGIQALEDFL